MPTSFVRAIQDSHSLRFVLTLVVGMAIAAATGCGQQAETADAGNTKTSSASETPRKDPAANGGGVSLTIQGDQKPTEISPATEADTAKVLDDEPIVVPKNATPDELVEFLRKVSGRRTLGKSEEDYLAKAKQKAEAMISAADQILAAKASPIARYEATVNKFNSLQAMHQLQIAEASEKLATFAADIPQIADEILAENTDAGLRKEVIAMKLGALFTAASQPGADVASFVAAVEAAATDKDPNVVNSAKQIQIQYRMGRLFSQQDPDASQLVAAVASALAGESPNPEFFSDVQEAVSVLEDTGHTEAATKVVDLIATTYGTSPDEQVAQFAKDWAETVKKRLSLIGSEVTLDGTLTNGQPLDWPALRGKVVLVDFWATWCQPCLKLLPELEQLHAKYHNQGLEIVGVSLDNDRKALDGFLANRQLPWPILANVAGKSPEIPEQNAVRYGVEAIPVVILVDKQGKAVATGLHGEKLAERVRQLLAQ